MMDEPEDVSEEKVNWAAPMMECHHPRRYWLLEGYDDGRAWAEAWITDHGEAPSVFEFRDALPLLIARRAELGGEQYLMLSWYRAGADAGFSDVFAEFVEYGRRVD